MLINIEVSFIAIQKPIFTPKVEDKISSNNIGK